MKSGQGFVILSALFTVSMADMAEGSCDDEGCSSDFSILQKHSELFAQPGQSDERGCLYEKELKRLGANVHRFGTKIGDNIVKDIASEIKKGGICNFKKPHPEFTEREGAPFLDDETIQLMWDQMEGIVTDAVADSEANEKDLDDSVDDINACSEPLSGAVNDTEESRLNHTNCRMEEWRLRNDSEAVCADFETYWSTLQLPECARNFPPATYEDALACVQSVGNWSNFTESSLTDHNDACNSSMEAHLQQRVNCTLEQEEFEEAYCDFTLVTATYTSCYDTVVATHRTLENQVAEDVAMSKIAVESARRIQCLLLVLNVTDPDSQSKMQEDCDDLHPDTDFLNVTFPEIPAIGVWYGYTLGPCADAWVEREYNNATWYSGAPTTECNSCE